MAGIEQYSNRGSCNHLNRVEYGTAGTRQAKGRKKSSQKLPYTNKKQNMDLTEQGLKVNEKKMNGMVCISYFSWPVHASHQNFVCGK